MPGYGQVLTGEARPGDERPLVPAGPAPARPPGSARRGRRRPGRGAVRAGPGAAEAGRTRRASPSCTGRLRALDGQLREHGGRLLVRRGDPAAHRVPGRRGGRGLRRAHQRRLRPVRPRPRRGGRGGARRRPARPHRLAVRGGPRPRDQGRRRALQGLHAVLPSLGPARLAPAGGHRSPVGSTGTPAWTGSRSPRTRALPAGLELPDAGEDGRARGVARATARRGCPATPTTATDPISIARRGCRST